MQDKGVSVAALLAALVAFPALANSLSGAWETELSLLPALGLASTLALDYTWDGLVLGSTSQLHPTGFIWQSFSLAGGWKTLSLKADLLLGPSTADYLYGQLILTGEVRRLELRLYAAQLSDAVLGGPGLGSALRLAGAAGEVQFVGILELGARIEDEDFHGIIIYHTTSGLWRHYATNPMTSGAGFTGAKLTLSGLRLCCLEGTEATLYFTKAGFDYLRFALSGINLGPFLGLRLDLEVEFQVQTKSLAFTPRVEREEVGCLELYFQVETGPSPGGVAGISLYGLGWECELGPVRGRGLTVLDTGRYVITTEGYGSEIESLTDAAENGHEFYPKLLGASLAFSRRVGLLRRLSAFGEHLFPARNGETVRLGDDPARAFSPTFPGPGDQRGAFAVPRRGGTAFLLLHSRLVNIGPYLDPRYLKDALHAGRRSPTGLRGPREHLGSQPSRGHETLSTSGRER